MKLHYGKTLRMLNNILNQLKSNKHLKPLWDVVLFAVLLFSFHFIYLAWSSAGFYPIGEAVNQFFNWGSRLLFNQSKFVIDLMGIDYYAEVQTFYITANDGSSTWLEVAPGCTAMKQWMHWVFLMALFPGPWRHKAWYIPLGLLVIQLVSIIRISGLALTLTIRPDQFHFFHDYIFKTLFYASIFLMWVIWVEFFRSKRS